MNGENPSANGLFIRSLERPPLRRRLWRALRWLPVGLLPLAGSCVMELEELLRRLGIDPCMWWGECVTTLAIGEEGGM